MIDIVDRLRFDAVRCEAQFSKGVASNIDAGADEIERLRKVLTGIAEYCSGEDRSLGAVVRLASVRNTAQQALRVLHPQS